MATGMDGCLRVLNAGRFLGVGGYVCSKEKGRKDNPVDRDGDIGNDECY